MAMAAIDAQLLAAWVPHTPAFVFAATPLLMWLMFGSVAMSRRKAIEDLRQRLTDLESTASKEGLQALASILHLAILETDNLLGRAPTPLTIPGTRH